MRSVIAAVLLALFTLPLSAQYSTSFEAPTFSLGDVAGQDGWGHISNSPTRGEIEAAPHTGAQSLALRTRNVDFFGVANHLYSPTINPTAGETGSTVDGVVVPDPESLFSATLWYRAPATPVVSTRGDGRIAELNPSSKGPDADDPANRYAQVRVFNDPSGRVRVEIGWYRASGFTVATVAMLDWGQWYRFEYRILLVDGTDGAEPNDRFSLSIFDASGTRVGSACGSTWELGWKSGTFGGGATARAINGFDFWSTTGPNDTLVGHIDDLSFSASSPAAGDGATATITGNNRVCCGGTSTLTANITDATGTASSYTWRNGNGDVVGTNPTFDAPPGVYTVTITTDACETATSAPFAVLNSTAVPTLSEWMLGMLAAMLAVVALRRVQG